MTLAFRSSSGSYTPTTASDASVTKPTGVVDHDILIFAVFSYTGFPTSAPAGFTTLDSQSGTWGFLRTYRRIASSEPASYTWSWNIGATAVMIAALAYSGGDNTTPVDVHAIAIGADNTTTVNAPSVSPAGTNDVLVVIAGALGYGNASALTLISPPTGFTDRRSVSSSVFAVSSGGGQGNQALGMYLELADATLSAAGATGTKAFTPNKAVHTPFTSAIAIKAVPGPTVSSVAPNTGDRLGATSVTLTGTGFATTGAGTTTVAFGGTPATGVVVVNDTTITCVTPAHAAGSVNVTVTNNYGTGSLSNGFTYTAPPAAPTVTSASPAFDAIAGGRAVTLTGTGFTASSAGANTVTIGGVAATAVVAVNDTTITCVAPAHAAGQVDIVVTNTNGTSTLSNGFTYVDAKDATVKLVKGGAVVGSNKADTGTSWPLVDGFAVYGGPTDIWGTTLTPADVNAADFGIVLSATLGASSKGRVDSMSMRVSYTLPGLQEVQSLLSVLTVDPNHTTVESVIYQLPRNGMGVANDPSVDKRGSTTTPATFRTQRYWRPSRNILKLYREVEVDVEIGTSGTNQLTVSAYVDDVAVTLDANNSGSAVVTTSGRHIYRFPKTSASTGYDMALQFDTLGEVTVREVTARLNLAPRMTEEITLPNIVLGDGSFEDFTNQQATVTRQKAYLESLFDPDSTTPTPIPYRDPMTGEDHYGLITALSFKELSVPGLKAPTWVAQMKLRRLDYGD